MVRDRETKNSTAPTGDSQENLPSKEIFRKGLPGCEGKTLHPRRSYADYLAAAQISLWEQDFSEAKEYFECKKAEGIRDFHRFLHDHPEDVIDLSGKVRSCAVNTMSLGVFRNSGDMQLHDGPHPVTDKDSYKLLLEQLIALAEERLGADQEPITLFLPERGKVLHVRMAVPPGCEQALHTVFTAVVDISSSAKLHQSPGASEGKLRSLFESASDAMLLADVTTGTVLEVNRQVEKLLGLSGRSIVGTPLAMLLPFSARDGKGGNHQNYRETYVMRHPSREKVPVAVSTSLARCESADSALIIVHEMRHHGDEGLLKAEEFSSESDGRRARLTAREKEILRLIVSGKTNREIAQGLSLSTKTVETHRSRSMRKLDLHNTASLVKYVLHSGLE